MKFQIKADELKKIDEINDIDRLFYILVSVMARLRSPEGCMWDREQTNKSIKRNLIEETYEAVESIENDDFSGLKEELGDLLLQIVFHSQIASENKKFDIAGVLRGIIKKLIRRHPHVFKGASLNSSKEILANWEDIKRKERKVSYKKPASVFSGIPRSLPSLHFAYEIQNRASRLGFDWNNAAEVFEKIEEELAELKIEIKKGRKTQISNEIGDILFTIVNFARHIGVDCEEKLSEVSKKFIQRFDFMEEYAERNNLDFKELSQAKKDKLWEIAKRELS